MRAGDYGARVADPYKQDCSVNHWEWLPVPLSQTVPFSSRIHTTKPNALDPRPKKKPSHVTFYPRLARLDLIFFFFCK